MKILYTDEMNCGLSYEFFTLVAEAVFNELDMSNNEYEISWDQKIEMKEYPRNIKHHKK